MTKLANGSSSDTKEKNSSLDEDVGKEFFSSLKSMSLAEDDPMDFSFEPPAKNQKKTFKFENLDMGFDLDGDFGKLSSFKVDMPDFDFSRPSKKNPKMKEGSENKSTENSKQKKDQFSFSFDFNELDGFDLDSSLSKKGSETSNKKIYCEEAVSKRKGADIEGLDFDSCLGENAQATSIRNQDIKTVKLDKTENLHSKTSNAGFVADNPRRKQGVLGSIGISEAESPPGSQISNHKTDAVCLGPQSLNESPDKTVCPMTEGKDEQSPSTRDTTSSPSRGSGKVQAAEQGPYTNGNDFNGDTGSDIHKVCSFAKKGDCPRVPDQTVHGNLNSAMKPGEERTQSKTSASLCMAIEDKPNFEQKERITDTLCEIMDQTRTTQSDPDTADTPTSFSGNIHPDNCAKQNVQIQNSDTNLSLALYRRAPKLNSFKAAEETQAGSIRSRFFKRPDRTESDALQPCPARLETARQQVNLERIGPTSASSLTVRKGKFLVIGTESSNKSRISSLERLKPGKIALDMPKADTVRTIEPNEDPLGSASHVEVGCSANKERNIQVQAKKGSEIHPLLQPSSLKRKDPGEDPNVGLSPLRPLKRFSLSPSESRNPEEFSSRAAEVKFCSQENRFENKTKNLTHDSPNTGSKALQQINVKELEISLAVEKDDNLEKAEAYTKELENICNILRKKHEHAKELLVRAVVSNNYLLMLNHPIYEEKIRMVQKFAAKLTPKELPMQSQTMGA